MNTEQIFKSIDSKEPAMLKFLETLVNIDSAKDSLEGIHQVAEHIKAKLVELGFVGKLVGTPGAATIVIPSIKINPANRGKSNGIPCIIINASAQATIFRVLPDR